MNNFHEMIANHYVVNVEAFTFMNYDGRINLL